MDKRRASAERCTPGDPDELQVEETGWAWNSEEHLICFRKVQVAVQEHKEVIPKYSRKNY